MKSKTFKGLIRTEDGLSITEMFQVPLDDLKEANSQTTEVRGFRILYGRTEDGKVVEFMKAGRLAKRDLNFIQKVGVVEAVCSWFAPKHFQIPEGQVEISLSFALGGKKTQELMDLWAKALLS